MMPHRITPEAAMYTASTPNNASGSTTTQRRYSIYIMIRKAALYTILNTLLLFAQHTHAALSIIDQVDIQPGQKTSRINIEFTSPVQLLSHSPGKHGSELQIRLRLNSTNANLTDEQQDNEMAWEPTQEIPLRFIRIEYETTTRPNLILHFSKSVTFSIPAQKDPRKLTIELVTPPQKSSMEKLEPRLTERKNTYVINLISSTADIDKNAMRNVDTEPEYFLYRTQTEIRNRLWNRLRLGFFRTMEEALQAQQSLLKVYPESWIAKIGDDEIALARSGRNLLGEKPAIKPSGKRPPESKPEPAVAMNNTAKAEGIMLEARNAMTEGDYRRAISLYTKILQLSSHRYMQQAQEFLGLAREKNRQFAHAKAEYEKYLALYPDGEDSERVKQRLVSLVTASKKDAPELVAGRKVKQESAWSIYGGFSQFYRRDVSITDLIGSSVDQSSLSSDLDISARKRSEGEDIRTRFTGGYLYDFLDEAGEGSNVRISSMYLDYTNTEKKWSARVGRQSRSSGGVLGRFDGIHVSQQWSPDVKLNAVAGFPVDSTTDDIATNRRFYGVSADIGTFYDSLDFVVFLIEQTIDSITDRRAIGGEVRYFDQNRTILGLLDYDILYDDINILLLLGNWTLPNKITINTTIDYRKSPLLTTRNAIQGQSTTSIDSMLTSYTESELQQIAEDRTATSKSFTFGLSKPITEKLQISGDVTVSNLSETRASAGVEATPGTGNEYFYNLQLIGNSLIKKGDIAILGLRYSDTSSSNTTSVLVNTRYPINSAWRINPKVRVDYRENHSDGSQQWTAAPSLRTEYIWKRRYRFEAEVGGEISDRKLSSTTDRTRAYFVNLGYRIDF